VIKIPHVVIEGKLNTQEIFKIIEPLFIKEENLLLKSTNLFLSQDETIILIEILVIEDSNKNQFFAIVNQRDDGVVVRIHPMIDVEKTNGVKRSLAEIGKQILNKFAGAKIGKTNLSDFL
jgi:hypothetical protein